MRSRRSGSLCVRIAVALVCAGSAIVARESEERSGGDTTVYDDGPQAYGRALANLDPLRWSEFRAGKARFVGTWPERGPASDAASCSDCHFRDGRGPRPDSAHRDLVWLLRLGRWPGGGDPTYGAQLLRLGHGAPPPGRFTVRWIETSGRYPSGERYSLRRPAVEISELAHGPLDPATRFSLRTPPAVFGLGLIGAVADETIIEQSDPEDADGDGISGRAQRVRDATTGAMVIGRFGWKAAQPSLATQSAAALVHDLGVKPNAADVGALVRYLNGLAVPARRRWSEPAVREGERLFAQIGCGTCHRPQITSGRAPDWPELSRQVIRPYTDLLLHDMGADLADGVVDESALAGEWRTPPLWGLGLLPIVSGEMRLLHDGRARSFEEAILWHGGEAAPALDRFMRLPRAKRDALTTFLGTL